MANGAIKMPQTVGKTKKSEQQGKGVIHLLLKL
jgi:hypothetical protein